MHAARDVERAQQVVDKAASDRAIAALPFLS
jgi:hypothetical protein